VLTLVTIHSGLRIGRHWWVDPYLLPPVEAMFSMDGTAGTSISGRRCAGEGVNG